MAQYIDKDALVAEIYRLRDFANDRWDIEEVNGVDKFLDKLIPFIHSLEVKEAELNDEICKDLNDDGTCMYIANKTGNVMRCEYINCCRKIKAQKGE